MRVYDNKYLSVTSIVGLRQPFNKEAFVDWCKREGFDSKMILKTSQILGTKVSEHIENISNGLEWLTAPVIDQVEGNLYKSVDAFNKEYEIIATEQIVVCEDLHYAGRYDGIIKDKKGTQYLADWKTYGAWRNKPYTRSSSKIKKVRWQLSMYAHALDWKEKLAVVVFQNDGTWELEELKFDKDMIKWCKINEQLILSEIKNAQLQQDQREQV
jgi:hypothetical protein